MQSLWYFEAGSANSYLRMMMFALLVVAQAFEDLQNWYYHRFELVKCFHAERRVSVAMRAIDPCHCHPGYGSQLQDVADSWLFTVKHKGKQEVRASHGKRCIRWYESTWRTNDISRGGDGRPFRKTVFKTELNQKRRALHVSPWTPKSTCLRNVGFYRQVSPIATRCWIATCFRTQTLVQSKAIASASLHRPLPLKWHFYVWPFASMLYPVWIYIYFFKYDIYLGSEEWTFVTIGTILTLHALSFLVCQWSVSIKAFLTCVKVKNEIRYWEKWTTMLICGCSGNGYP